MKTVSALEWNTREEIDFAVSEAQKMEFRELVAELNRQTGEDWSEYLSEVEVDYCPDTGRITTDKGNIYSPTTCKGNGNFQFHSTVY